MTREEQLSAAMIVAKEFGYNDLATKLQREIKRMRYTPEDDELIQDLTDMLFRFTELRQEAAAKSLAEVAEAFVDLAKERYSGQTVYKNLNDIPVNQIVVDRMGDEWCRIPEEDNTFALRQRAASDRKFYGNNVTEADKISYGPFTATEAVVAPSLIGHLW